MDKTKLLDPNFKSKSPPDSRDHIANLPKAATLPPSVDLKPDVEEVEDQLNYNSCTANAGCSAMELLYNSVGIKKDFSRMFLYFYVRMLGNVKGDNGAYPRDIGKALANYGTCYESTWDYVSKNLNTEPNDIAKKEALGYKIVSYAKLDNNLDAIKNSLAQGIPVLMAMTVHEDFFNVSGNWKKNSWSITGKVEGGHEVLVIGYDDASKRLLVENSWGKNWGDGGFFGFPYEYLPKVADEFWVIVPNLNKALPKPAPVAGDKTLFGWLSSLLKR